MRAASPALTALCLALSSVAATSARAQTAPDPRYAQLPALEWFAVNTNETVRARLYRDDGTVELACAPAWEASNYAAQAHDPWRAMARLQCVARILRAETAPVVAVALIRAATAS